MRISDWSSDVCSSDLIKKLHYEMQNTLRKTTSLHRLRRVVGHHRSATRDGSAEERGANVDIGSDYTSYSATGMTGEGKSRFSNEAEAADRDQLCCVWEEIGRAVCRERVWQEVL